MDLIFLAAIAIFIVLRLRDQLGKISDEEKDQIAKKIQIQKQKILEIQKLKEKESFLQNNALEKEASEKTLIDEKYAKKLSQDSIDNLQNILTKLNISTEFFIQGAKSAFEMTLNSFAKNDLKTLKLLLGDKLYAGFKNSIDSRKKEEKTLHTEIVSISDGKITSVNIDKNKAFITAEFTSKQINYLTNKKDEIVQGSKEQVNELKDIWTFKKDLEDASPNWKVSTTS